MLVRGHAIKTRILDDIISVKVPNLYKLTLGLPASVLEHSTTSFFDCKVRRLFIIAPTRRIHEVSTFDEVPEELQPETTVAPDVSEEPLISAQPVSENMNTDSMLFDIV